jgi:hypothetical protein
MSDDEEPLHSTLLACGSNVLGYEALQTGKETLVLDYIGYGGNKFLLNTGNHS